MEIGKQFSEVFPYIFSRIRLSYYYIIQFGIFSASAIPLNNEVVIYLIAHNRKFIGILDTLIVKSVRNNKVMPSMRQLMNKCFH